MSLETLLQRADLWRGGDPFPAGVGRDCLSTGFPALDARFPGGGWPLGALTEVLTPRDGIGGMALVLPALARLSRQRRWIAWVAPPYLPYAPALADAGVDLSRVLLVHPRATHDGLWAVEQILRAGTCSAVLAWPAAGGTRALRRLQLAAGTGDTWGVLFRPERMAAEPSPAVLRLRVQAAAQGMSVHILKRRGAGASGPVWLGHDPPDG